MLFMFFLLPGWVCEAKIKALQPALTQPLSCKSGDLPEHLEGNGACAPIRTSPRGGIRFRLAHAEIDANGRPS